MFGTSNTKTPSSPKPQSQPKAATMVDRILVGLLAKRDAAFSTTRVFAQGNNQSANAWIARRDYHARGNNWASSEHTNRARLAASRALEDAERAGFVQTVRNERRATGVILT